MTIQQIIDDLRNELKTYFNENCEYFKGYQDCLDELEERLSNFDKEDQSLVLRATSLKTENERLIKENIKLKEMLKQERN